MATRLELVVPTDLDIWQAGFTLLPEELVLAAAAQWEIATDLFFDNTQQVVHVITGDLKASGRSSVSVDGQTVVGEIVYGDVDGLHGFVDYAQFEEDRGGDHAYLARGWEASQSKFEAAMGLAWSSVVAGWSGTARIA
jgi:hypothetical protein